MAFLPSAHARSGVISSPRPRLYSSSWTTWTWTIASSFLSWCLFAERRKKKERKNHVFKVQIIGIASRGKKRRAIKSSKCISLRPLTIITHSHASPEDFKLRPLRLISPREARNVTCRYVRQYTCDVLFKPYRKTKSALPGVDDTRDGF